MVHGKPCQVNRADSTLVPHTDAVERQPQRVTLVGAARSIPSAVAVLVPRRCCGERQRRRGGHAEWHTALNGEGAGRERIGTRYRPCLDRLATLLKEVAV